METSPLIEFIDVTKRFDGRTILDRVNLKIYEGQITTLIGKSGAGKSVLLKHIIGLLKPDDGTILFRGKPLDHMSKGEWNACMNQISYIFQNNALFDSLTVFENIALPLRETTRLSKKEIKAKVTARIKQFELTDVADKYPEQLSGGMQKRVALSRALVTDPEIVLFDEPTTGQDPVRRNAIFGMIAEYQRKFGFTAVLISHDIPDVYFVSDRILVLYNQKIVFQGSPEEFEDFDHPFHNELVQSLEDLQKNLSGLYAKRNFKIRYQKNLRRKAASETYAVALFTLENLDTIIRNLGPTAAQQSIRAMGAYICKHFCPRGGFCTRRSINQFGTVLLLTDLDEAGGLLEDFRKDFQKEGRARIEAAAKSKNPVATNFEFSIFAGLARGNPNVEFQSLMELAEFTQKLMARFRCEVRG